MKGYTILNNELISLIEKKRADLLKIVSKYGVGSELAIKYSQELDKLLNQYNRDEIKIK